MKTSKTLRLINLYTRQLNEQDGDLGEEDQMGGEVSPDVTENPEPAPEDQDVMPMSSEGENAYISGMIDAALYTPNAEDSQTLLNLQSVMELKRFKNAREEVLPLVLQIIRSSTDSKNLKDNLNQV